MFVHAVHAEPLVRAGKDVLLAVTLMQRGLRCQGFLFANNLPVGGCPLALGLVCAQVRTRARGSDALLHVRGRPLDGQHE